MNALRLRRVGHAYLGRTVLDGVDLAVAPGEIVALVGPSGCGKSTLVHLAAGLAEPLRGRIERGYRQHAMVFQESRLLPWATALDNIAYPLRVAGIGARARRERAAAVAARVALEPADLHKFPLELSGGMRQRVAIARALAVEPDFVYFDEPFTALDVALKRRMQDLIIAAAEEARFGALFVTHDLMEAARLAGRIAVLDARGRGIVGERALAGAPRDRTDRALFDLVQRFLHDDPVFLELQRVDERGRDDWGAA